MKVKTSGFRELEAKLREMDITVARKKGIARRALDRAAEPIAAEWRRGVDVEKGDLKRSIKTGNRAQTRGTRRFKRGAGQDIVERYIGIDARENERLGPIGKSRGYAFYEEFGDDNRPANPAGRRAWESKKMGALDDIKETLADEIYKVARRLAK